MLSTVPAFLISSFSLFLFFFRIPSSPWVCMWSRPGIHLRQGPHFPFQMDCRYRPHPSSGPHQLVLSCLYRSISVALRRIMHFVSSAISSFFGILPTLVLRASAIESYMRVVLSYRIVPDNAVNGAADGDILSRKMGRLHWFSCLEASLQLWIVCLSEPI